MVSTWLLPGHYLCATLIVPTTYSMPNNSTVKINAA